MAISRLVSWRLWFLLGGVLVIAGGLQHPRGGSMVAMLANPAWVPSHTLILAGYAALAAGLFLFGRSAALPPGTARWTRLSFYAMVLSAAEMVLHTAASVDHGNLAAGRAAPVFTTHIWSATVVQPILALAIVGFILATARERTLASPWIAWLGIAGAVAHGAAPILVVALGLGQFWILFPLVMLLALWFAVAALWPVRAGARMESAELAAGT